MISFFQVSPPKPFISLFSPPYVLHDPPISFFSILSPEKYWARNTDHTETTLWRLQKAQYLTPWISKVHYEYTVKTTQKPRPLDMPFIIFLRAALEWAHRSPYKGWGPMAYTVIHCWLYEASGLFILFGAVCYSFACQFISFYYTHYPPPNYLCFFLSFWSRIRALNKGNLCRIHFCIQRTGTHNTNKFDVILTVHRR